MKIQDSGDRTKFESGAVRDMGAGKGRLDLVPLSVMAKLTKDTTLTYLSYYQRTGEVKYLYQILEEAMRNDKAFLILELAKYFEKGAEKYGEDNWKKGIPLNSYLDSATRHYLKYLELIDGEDHFMAFLWNITCLIATIEKSTVQTNINAVETIEVNDLAFKTLELWDMTKHTFRDGILRDVVIIKKDMKRKGRWIWSKPVYEVMVMEITSVGGVND